MAQPTRTLQQAPSLERQARGAVPAVFLCGMCAFLNLYCTQPLLPTLIRTFHTTEAGASLTISASTLGVALAALLLAIFAEQVNRRRTILISMLLLAAAAMLTTTATSLTQVVLWRFLQGLLTPGIFIITIAYITEEWPARQVPGVMSIYVAGTVFGGFVGRLGGGLITDHLGWRTVFPILGALGFFGTAAAARLLPRARSQRPAAHPAPWHQPLLQNLVNSRLLATFGIGFCMLFTLVSIFSYITFYLAARPFRLSPTDLSWLFAVYLLGLVATLIVGRFLARIGLRPGILGAVVACIAGIACTLVPTLPMVGLGLALASSGVFISQACCNSFLRDAAPAGRRVSAAGMYICSYYIGGTTGGILPAVAWRYAGWPGCVALTASALILAGLLAFFGWRPLRHDPVLV